MLTLQILDSGQTFFHSLEGRSVLLGSAEDADVRLTEEGVAPHHARIEPIRRGDRTLYKIVDLESAPGTKVNGAPVAQVLLELGDRVELGRAVLVLGTSVNRPATAEDVLEDNEPRAPALRRSPRARVDAATHRSGSRWLWPVALGGAALLVLGFVLFGGNDNRLPASIQRVEVLRRAGQFDEARSELARLGAGWAGGVPERLDLLAAEEARIDAVELAMQEQRRALLADAENASYAELNRRLQTLEREGATAEVREAARILRGDLTAILDAAGIRGPRLPADAVPGDPEDGARLAGAGPGEAPGDGADPRPDVRSGAPPGDPPPDRSGDRPAGAPGQSTVAGGDAADVEAGELFSAIERLRGQGLYAQAIEAARSAMAQAGSASAAEPYRNRLDELRAEARGEMQQLVDTARRLEEEGKRLQAIDHLAAHAHRFPDAGDLALLNQELANLRDAEARAGRSPAEVELAQTRRVSLDLVAELLAQVRQHERDGDFPGAVELLRRGADLVVQRDPRYAERLRDQAADYELIGELSEQVAAALNRPVEIELRDGRPATVTSIAGSRLQLESAEGDFELTWPEVPLTSVRTLLQRTGAPARAWLGAAVLAYRNADRDTAEALLAHALKSESGLKEGIDRVITRGRRDRRDPRGYELVKGEFVSARELESRELAKQLERRLSSVLRQKEEARDRFLEETLARGPEALDALLIAFRGKFRDQADELRDHSVKRQYDKLQDQRIALDEARRHALDLIYDEQRYFYPYKPPAVSGSKHAEYNEVQREVDERIELVRAVWRDERLEVRVPSSLKTEVAKLEWLGKVLADFGENDPEAWSDLEWLRTLPAEKEPVTIRNFCQTEQERRDLDFYERIEAYNERMRAKLNTEERRQVEITNEYRRMFGHRPLAVNEKILEAARGHAVEMANLGYFGHFSPTEGRRTPFDRMRIAGYNYGVSENIARNSSPEGAHAAWLRSSGHHRNLLNPHHTEFAVGVAAGNYVQNFGRGEEFKSGL